MIASTGRPFPLFRLLTVLCAGILLTPLVTGCSGKKNPKAGKAAFQKKQAKGTKKGKGAAAKSSSGSAVFTRLVLYEGISLNDPFHMGEAEILMKIDPAKGIKVCETGRLPGGKITLNAATGRIIRIEAKKQYETDQEAVSAFGERKAALEKVIGMPLIRQAQGEGFSETIASGEERSIQLILSGCTVHEVVTVSAMPKNPSVPEGEPVLSLFGLELGKPIPKNMINEDGMMLFYPDYPREEFKIYNYFNDREGNVQTIMAKSDPKQILTREDLLEVVGWLEEKFAMKMSYEGESAVSGVFRYSKDDRIVELRWKDEKLTVSARILNSGKKK